MVITGDQRQVGDLRIAFCRILQVFFALLTVLRDRSSMIIRSGAIPFSISHAAIRPASVIDRLLLAVPPPVQAINALGYFWADASAVSSRPINSGLMEPLSFNS